MRRVGAFFDHQIDDLSAAQLTDYFSQLRLSHSWQTLKLDLYALKFYYQHVLQKPWVAPGLVKGPKVRHLPNIVTTAQLQQIVATTRAQISRVFLHALLFWGCVSAKACAFS